MLFIFFPILDAAKRKQLPAWIREGLEKMEREKQKKIERERMLKQREEEMSRRRIEEEQAAQQQINTGIPPKSKFVCTHNLRKYVVFVFST